MSWRPQRPPAQPSRTALLAASAAIALLTGCAEKPQTNTGTGAKPDTPAWQGTADRGNPAPGFKPGDANSWNEQMRQRGQNQNEYTRASGRS